MFGIEVDAVLGHVLQALVGHERAVLDLGAAGLGRAPAPRPAACACTSVRSPCAFASPHAASSCASVIVCAPPSRMLFDAKILMRSAPAAFCLRT